MCRILGFCGNSNARVTALLRGLLLAEEKHNPHGTGIVIKKPDGSNLFQKRGIRGVSFLLQGYADFLSREKYHYALGHLRFKTAGEQSDRNAHPFGVKVHNRWHYGIHNGIISHINEIAREFGVKKASVDSETILRCIAKLQNEGESAADAIERVTYFTSDKGDFAFAYMTENEIFFWRNEQRPLCVFDVREYGMGRFLASTKEMFTKAWNWACPNLDLRKVTYFESPPYRLYRMSADTTPKYEVVAIKDMPRIEKKREIEHSIFSNDSYGPLFSYRQNSLWNNEPDEEADIYGVRNLSDDELENHLLSVEVELGELNGDEDDMLREQWSGYIRALKKELARRVHGVHESKDG